VAIRAPEGNPRAGTTGARVKRTGASAWAKGSAVADRCHDWVDKQDPATRRGAIVVWYRRYRESDGGLFTVLVSTYFFITAIPAAVVMVSYAYDDPNVVADRLSGRLDLTGSVRAMVHSVLAGASGHQLGATLIAVGDVLVFGMGFGRVLQVAHARSWKIDLGKPQFVDQARYIATLVVPLLLLLLYVLQTKALHDQPSWIGWLLIPVWVTVLLAYLVWMPHTLLHGRVTRRDLVPGAVLTLLGFVGLRLISALLFRHWLEWYSKFYGSLGIVMALFFWILLFGGVMVFAAAFAPALAHRRNLRQSRVSAEVAPA
jgi:uncharacterized BrkB/YihY/UPF0761 family membrane protein